MEDSLSLSKPQLLWLSASREELQVADPFLVSPSPLFRTSNPSTLQVVLAEDKKYYPTAEEVYGDGVETLVMDEDEQPLEQPIIKHVRTIKFEFSAKESSTYVSTEFLLGLASNPALVRNVALVGHHQHRKTLFMDMLVEQTHGILTFDMERERHMRYTDTRIDE